MSNIKAFILAAGKGERMNSLTMETPKPLVKIGTLTILESIIRFLHENLITDIHVITGYKKEKFESDYLKKYNLKFIYNPDFDISNNISSIYHAKDFLDRMIVIEGDIFFDNSVKFNLELESSYSYYLTEKVDNSKEWIVSFDDFITNTEKKGGSGYRIYGVSYWTKEDAIKLRDFVIYEFEQNKNFEIYWDEIVLDLYLKKFAIQTFEIPKDFLFEIDTDEDYKLLNFIVEKKNEIF